MVSLRGLSTGTIILLQVYGVLLGLDQLVPWNKLIWCKFLIPKHSFIAWLAALNRLPTKDRLVSWEMQVEDVCLLCRTDKESRDHLFFTCSFSQWLWQQVLELCQLHISVFSWEQELQWATEKLRGKALISTILRIAWNGSIHLIERERNHRLPSNQENRREQLLEHLKKLVSLRLQRINGIQKDSVNELFCNS